VKKLGEKPFALIGVNVNAYDAKHLKEVMAKEELNWRSTADQGAIAARWNSPGTPVYYVIDPTGVIRYKWVGNPGEKAIDAGLEKLIQEAERDARKAPK
jgi:hypothetical protein